jgi:hypothetical protein
MQRRDGGRNAGLPNESGPPGATITLISFAVAHCTSARPLCAAPATSSIVHSPSTVSQPTSGLLKSNASSDWAARRPFAATDVPTAEAPATNCRRDMAL